MLNAIFLTLSFFFSNSVFAQEADIVADLSAENLAAYSKMSPFEKQFLTNNGTTSCVPYVKADGDLTRYCFIAGNKDINAAGSGWISSVCWASLAKRQTRTPEVCDTVLENGILK